MVIKNGFNKLCYKLRNIKKILYGLRCKLGSHHLVATAL